LSPLIDELALFDVVNTPGVAADLSHISTCAVTTGYLKSDEGGLEKTLTGCDLVIIPAGIPRKPGMTRDQLFNINAGIVRDLVTGIAKCCPKAFVLIISNPVNSTVPVAVEVMKSHNVFDANRIFGVTTLDVVRASTFTAEVIGEKDCGKLTVPVVGGHSGDTIVPLLSLANPPVSISEESLDELVKRIQFGGDEVVKAKDGAGSATLSMAYAGFRFAEAVLKACRGATNIVEPSYIYLPGVAGGEEIQKLVGGLEYFAVPVELGPNGILKAHNPISKASELEKKHSKVAFEGLKTNIEKGIEFVKACGSKL
jgi:malate dehydrogenase